jgi:glycosyltransferase involved in cell wall biosynthesis
MDAPGGARAAMTDSPPRVSVIVPAYNAAEHIAQALESVKAQTVEDWEVVVCDDGSSDDTAAIAEGFGERMRVVRSPHNEGLACARNRAIGAARGELVALLDADDVWLPNYLERQLERYDQTSRESGEVGIVTCDAYMRDAGGQLPGTYADRFGCADGASVEQLLDMSPIFISSLIPRAALERVGLFATDLRSCEDLDLWLRLVESGYRVVATPEPLVTYLLSPGQLSAQPVAMARARQAVYLRALARGRLSPAQRRAAERAIRRERGVEAIATLREDIRAIRLPRMRKLGLIVRVLAENPSRLHRRMRLLRALRSSGRPTTASAPWRHRGNRR